MSDDAVKYAADAARAVGLAWAAAAAWWAAAWAVVRARESRDRFAALRDQPPRAT